MVVKQRTEWCFTDDIFSNSIIVPNHLLASQPSWCDWAGWHWTHTIIWTINQMHTIIDDTHETLLIVLTECLHAHIVRTMLTCWCEASILSIYHWFYTHKVKIHYAYINILNLHGWSSVLSNPDSVSPPCVRCSSLSINSCKALHFARCSEWLLQPLCNYSTCESVKSGHFTLATIFFFFKSRFHIVNDKLVVANQNNSSVCWIQPNLRPVLDL